MRKIPKLFLPALFAFSGLIPGTAKAQNQAADSAAKAVHHTFQHLPPEGRSIKLIDGVIEWRKSHPGDASHMSVLPLRALHREIQKMGLDAFRGMSEDQTNELYSQMIIDHGMSPEALREALIHEKENIAGKILHHVEAIFSTTAPLPRAEK